ncbi:HPF/RaiA family ribosome-associated protein [Candidatus Woesearchaeota archaeon]|nr:HPF/RaiA family ribosome-associated protein [Candidatus Woesearchaeota archaeon]
MLNKIKCVGDFSRINDEEKEVINKKLSKFCEKHSIDFSEIYINLDCHIHKETSRGRTSYYVKLNVDSDNGRFHAENQDFGAEKTISGALKKLDSQIMKKRGE